MQVILLSDVDRVGHEGDVLKVADGYARNYLLPRGLAVKADKGTLRDLEARRQAIERRDAEKRTAAQKAAEELQGRLIEVKATTGQGTRLHGTVTTSQIAAAASQQLGIEVDRRDIDVPEPIREVGNYLVSVRLYKDVAAQMPVQVVPLKSTEDEAQEDPELAAAGAELAAAEAGEAAGADEGELPEDTEPVAGADGTVADADETG